MFGALSKLVLELYRGCHEQPVDAYQDWAFERLKGVLHFDSALWLTAALHSGGDAEIHTNHLHNQPLQLLIDWARCPGKTVFSKKVLQSPGISFTCVPSMEFGKELAEHSRRYDIEHILATSLVEPVANLSELISLYRADLNQPFNEEERRLQQDIVPHLSETWRINRSLHLIRISQPACAAKAHAATADAKGVLHLVEPGFTRLLLDEWPDWRGPRLPGELAAAIENREQRFVGKTLVIRFSGLNDLFLLHVRKKSRVDALSQREREVANHFSTGSTYKEIARSLSLSPTTVRNYLNTVYLKLGIGNKAELANLLKDHG